MKKTHLFVGIVMAATMSTAAVAETITTGQIKNGDFENGISGFGVCYSGRQDTVLPVIYPENKVVKDGSGALELSPGATLLVEESNNPLYDGEAYQGFYYKKPLAFKKDVKYTISCTVFPEKKNVKGRFIVTNKGKTVARSEEFELIKNQWNYPAFAYIGENTLTDVIVKVALYDVEEGKSIYADNFVCREAILDNYGWKPSNLEAVQTGRTVSFEVVKDENCGIYVDTDKADFTQGSEYVFTADVSTAADRVVLSVCSPTLSGIHNDYVLKRGERVKVSLPYDVSALEGGYVRTEIIAKATSAGNIILENAEIVDVKSAVHAKEENGKIKISGALRPGNENRTISLNITGAEEVTAETNSVGRFSLEAPIPQIEGARKKLTVTVSNINGYADMDNCLTADFYVINEDYINDIAEAVKNSETVETIKLVLTDETLLDIGIAGLPVFISADKEDIFESLLKMEITDAESLLDSLEIASVYSSLENKSQSLSDMIAEFGELLDVENIQAYKDLYNTVDKTTLDKIFAETVSKIKDSDDFEYALTVALVRNEVNEKVNYSEQFKVLEKYAEVLNIDFSAYNKLSSVNRYNVSSELMLKVKDMLDYSKIQSLLNSLVNKYSFDIAPGGSGGSGGSGGNGGGGGNGGSVASLEGMVVVQKPEDSKKENDVTSSSYSFDDLNGFEWAKSSIYKLVEKGIISKPENKKFNPQDSITRAEFVKMVSVQFGVMDHTGKSKFNDVTENDWYYDYVMAMHEKGIIYGIEEDCFGSNMAITRQDICVILKKIINEEPSSVPEFTDMKDVSDYAKSAVALMREKGIINGYEDGSFGPFKPATRAEVAKMLCAMIK